MRNLKIDPASLLWQEDGRPYSPEFDDVYFSRGDEIAESRHVFLNANKLDARWQELADAAQSFVIAELGFGFALNFLNTWQSWLAFKSRAPHCRLRLHYVAFEKHPVRHADLARMHALWPEFAEYSTTLLRHYPDHSAGCHRLLLAENVILDLHYGEALDSLRRLATGRRFHADCWYADGFNPKSNPALWQNDLFALLAKCSDQGSTLSSYSVAGTVRRALQEAGFDVRKTPGFGQKRHMLSASLAAPGANPAAAPGAARLHKNSPVHSTRSVPESKHISIIGAGLAGCTLAHSLATRGWQVTVLEAQEAPALGASGSGQLNLRCQFLAESQPLTRFYLHAFLFARRQFAALPNNERFWFPSGLVQLDSSLKPGNEPAKVAAYKSKLLKLYERAILESADAETLSELAGIAVHQEGLYLPLGGWIEPTALLQAYLQHPAIELRCSQRIAGFTHSAAGWHYYDETQRELGCSPVLALCTGAGIQQWQQTRSLPLQALRGQTTRIRDDSLAAKVRTVLCGKRTLFPALDGQQIVAASYHRHAANALRNVDDDEENLRLLSEDLAPHTVDMSQYRESTVGIRYNSIDHAPLIGAMPNLTPARPPSGAAQIEFLPDLYVNTAHSSSGLATCPLAGEHLASLINGDPVPLDQQTERQLAPARFLRRELQRKTR